MKVLLAITVAAVLAIAQAEDLFQYKNNNLFAMPLKRAPYNPKIVGGNEAEPHSYPHAVILQVDRRYYCGGSIITKDVVLTAAHCVDSVRLVDVIAGAHNLSKAEPTQQKIRAFEFVIHEDWDRRLLINDIALIKLSTSLILNNFVQPIGFDNGDCLSKDLDNIQGTVSGWGVYNSEDKMSPVLREVTNRLLSNKECAGWLGTAEDTLICLSGEGGKSSCSGDSGSALLGFRNGSKVEVGIVSFGVFGCGCYGFPAGFTRVACFYDWINEKLNHFDIQSSFQTRGKQYKKNTKSNNLLRIVNY